MTAGALNTMFTDQPGPYRLRMQRMLLAALAAGISALVGILIGENTTLFVIAAVMFGLLGGLLVALGPDAGRAGLTSMIVMMITADMGLPVVHAPGRGGDDLRRRPAADAAGDGGVAAAAISAGTLRAGHRAAATGGGRAHAPGCGATAAGIDGGDGGTGNPARPASLARRGGGIIPHHRRVVERMRLELLALGDLDTRDRRRPMYACASRTSWTAPTRS